MMKITIKLKKEYGWFLFLFTPFIVMISLHILMPLLMAVDHHPTLKESYVEGKANNQITNLITLSLSNSQKLIDRIMFYQQQLRDIEMIFQKNFRQLDINHLDQSLYQIKMHQQSNSSSDLIFFSNRYSPNFQNYSDLPQDFIALHKKYKAKESMLVSSLAILSSQGVTNIVMYARKGNQSIVYTLQNENGTLQLQKFWNIMPLLKLGQVEDQNITKFLDNVGQDLHISFCRPILFDQQFQTIICIRLKYEEVLQKYAQTVQQPMNTIGTNDKDLYALKIPIYNKNTQQLYIINEIESIQNLQKRQLLKAYIESNETSLSTYQTLSTFYYYYVLETHTQTSPEFIEVGEYKRLFNSNNIKLEVQVDSLVIPIVVILVVFSVVVSCILIKLLKSIDSQLFELAKCCDYILEGDIYVQIPEFVGTKCVADVYQDARTINKLYRYSSDKYFTGHFSQKILKYNQALQFLKKLNYDLGFVLQNIGEACHWIEQWDKAIDSLKESVTIILRKIKQQYGTIEQMAIVKKTKKVPPGYKYLQNVLLRRVYKLSFSLLFAIQFQSFYVKFNQNIDYQQMKRKRQRWIQQAAIYSELAKKVFYPQLGTYSESVIIHINQAKQMANLKRPDDSLKLLIKSEKLVKIYEKQFPQITKKLKQKGSKFKLFHMKNRLSGQSRLNPQMMKNYLFIFKGLMLNQLNRVALDPQRELQAVDLLFKGFRCGVIVAVVYFLGVNELRRVLKELKIDDKKYQSTQIFIQAMPFRSFHQGQVPKEMESQVYKRHSPDALGLQRQFMIVTDCSKSQLKEEQEEQLEYSLERLMHIYEKLIKPTDRLSLTKFATTTGTKTEFNLTLKESSEIVLRNELKSVYNDLSTEKNLEKSIFDVVMRSIWRVKNLKSDKVVLVFLKSINFYANRQEQRKKKLTKRSKRKASADIQNLEKFLVEDECKHFGDLLVENLRDPQLRNCKVILYCSKEDSIEKTREFFNLKDINKRIWAQENQVNTRNVVVYLIESKHKVDIERILMVKYMIVVDNNVFVL